MDTTCYLEVDRFMSSIQLNELTCIIDMVYIAVILRPMQSMISWLEDCICGIICWWKRCVYVCMCVCVYTCICMYTCMHFSVIEAS